ncbi:VacJ family lipoprotein [Pelagibacteraceae bacterium]|jgi:phospholipid-binding lipoprotein MlaA|nr:VacJ family lipoprotein [Pelagibacteraceae bacterium]
MSNFLGRKSIYFLYTANYLMNLIKKITLIFLVSTLVSSKVSATDECFEGTSRAIFKFNMAFDNAILEPIAKGYNKLPEPIKKGTSNFTSNIATLLSIPNHVFQGNLKEAGDATASFLINSTIGIIGLSNPAEKLGFEAQKEDVGQTLGTYGFGPGCYFVLPILGPTTARDSLGMLADSFVDPFAHVTWRENELFGLSGQKLDYIAVKSTTAVDFRADNDANFESIEKNSIDLYASFKSLYLQDRENKIENSSESNDDWGSLDN